MILDTADPSAVPDEIEADIVVVGAGTVGLFLARCLATSSRRVLLIEAGGRVAGTSENTELARSIGKVNQGVLLGRARGLGGTSLLWGGQLAEFEESDFEDGMRPWPISLAELRRWYKVVYREAGIGARRPDADYREEFGRETLAHPEVERFFTAWLPQPNFARLFRSEITLHPRIRVILNATVNSIEFVDDRARCVRATTRRGARLRIVGEDFVFAAGTLETSRFFLAAQRHASVPWKESLLIGVRFHDHLGGKIAGVKVTDEARFREYFENGISRGVKLQPKLRLTAEARRKVFSGVCGMFAFRSSISENLSNIKGLVRSVRAGVEFSRMSTIFRDMWVIGRSFVPVVVRYVRDKRIMAFYDEGVDFHVQAEQKPVSTSRISLEGNDILPDGMWRVSLDWRIEGGEIHAIRDFALKADSYLRQRRIAKLSFDPLLFRADGDFLASLCDTYHQCGGLVMAADARKGVVDTECRVFGTVNVYVVGAAVFPCSGHANATLTALALAARLASKLRS